LGAGGVNASALIAARARSKRFPSQVDQVCLSIIIFLISEMALAGLRPLGQVLAQFMIV
jgi:hypothetical protein